MLCFHHITIMKMEYNMKIKEVSKKTGLTEKTIRYYEEKGLISPNKTDIRGRAFRDYLTHDIQELNTVAILRKADFTIPDIVKMRKKPQDIPGIVDVYIKNLAKKHGSLGAVVKRLKEVSSGELTDITK